MSNLTVAKTIQQQIGHKAFCMMGTKHLLGSENSLSFDVKGSRFCSHILIRLDPSDTYTIEFVNCRNHERHVVKSVDMVYWEDLHHIISSNTGLCLSL